MEYLVTWCINIDADTPEDAAKQALAIMQDKGSTATVFEIKNKDTGATCTVDLEEETEEETIHLDESLYDGKVTTDSDTNYYIRNTYDICASINNGGISGIDIYDDTGKFLNHVDGMSLYVNDGWELEEDEAEYNKEDLKEIKEWIEENLES